MKKRISASMKKYFLKKKVCIISEISKKFKILWNTVEKYFLKLVIEKKIEKIKKRGLIYGSARR